MSLSIHDELMLLTEELPCKCIVVDGKPYLERYFLSATPNDHQKWLHRFLAPDPENHFHTHPWFADSIILDGAYLEESAVLPAPPNDEIANKKLTMYRRGDLNVINPNTLHRIVECAPNTWSLMEVKPHREPWYFIEASGEVSPMMEPSAADWWKKYGTRNDET